MRKNQWEVKVYPYKFKPKDPFKILKVEDEHLIISGDGKNSII